MGQLSLAAHYDGSAEASEFEEDDGDASLASHQSAISAFTTGSTLAGGSAAVTFAVAEHPADAEGGEGGGEGGGEAPPADAAAAELAPKPSVMSGGSGSGTLASTATPINGRTAATAPTPLLSNLFGASETAVASATECAAGGWLAGAHDGGGWFLEVL